MKAYEKGISLSIWTLSWPIFIEVFLQMLVGNIDQLMMSHYSPQAVAAVANANQILNIFIMLIIVMSTATTIFDCPIFRSEKPVQAIRGMYGQLSDEFSLFIYSGSILYYLP